MFALSVIGHHHAINNGSIEASGLSMMLPQRNTAYYLVGDHICKLILYSQSDGVHLTQLLPSNIYHSLYVLHLVSKATTSAIVPKGS